MDTNCVHRARSRSLRKTMDSPATQQVRNAQNGKSACEQAMRPDRRACALAPRRKLTKLIPEQTRSQQHAK
eukprot:6193623-Pleurochrysis_carterae.AAC.1